MILLNTSFNVNGEPIVLTPYHAIRCFFSTGLDFLAIGSFIVGKTTAVLNDDAIGGLDLSKDVLASLYTPVCKEIAK